MSVRSYCFVIANFNTYNVKDCILTRFGFVSCSMQPFVVTVPYKRELYKMYVDFNIKVYNAMYTFCIFVRYTFCIFNVYILDYEFGTPLYT